MSSRVTASDAARQALKLSACIFCLLLLTACDKYLSVGLASPDERLPRPVFIVGNDDIHFDALTLSDITDANAQDVWSIRAAAERANAGAQRFAYGERVAGFEAQAEVKPLQPSRTYRLGVGGYYTDLFGKRHRTVSTLTFEVDSKGHLHAKH